MINEVTRELAAELRTRGVPYPVIYRESKPATIGSVSQTRIVVERDRKGGDRPGLPVSQFKNPQRESSRQIGCVIRIYAQSTLGGAREFEHEELADAIADQIEIALYNIAAKRKTLHRIVAFKLLDAAEMNAPELEQWPGVIYEIRFSIDRGVVDTVFGGGAKDSTTLAGIKSTTRVRFGTGPNSTACEAE